MKECGVKECKGGIVSLIYRVRKGCIVSLV